MDAPVRLPALQQAGVNQHSPAEAKIALFRSLFHGREGVYPRRFESRKTGKAGYSPVCGNEWVQGICEKPRIKCSECPHQRFLPVTDDVIRWHLQVMTTMAVISSWVFIRCFWMKPVSSSPPTLTKQRGRTMSPRFWKLAVK